MTAQVRPILRAEPAAEPVAQVVNVTPEMASKWLAKNTKNRNLRSGPVAAYARDMSAGRWQFTGEAIKFDNRGNLVDGQHRLSAVVQSGATIKALVIQGLDPNAQDVLDSGAKRSAADSLSLSGVQYAATVSAAARLAIRLKEGMNSQPTTSEIRAFVQANPDVIDAARSVTAIRSFIDLTPSVLTYAFMALSRIDGADAADFFTSLANNSTNGPGDPRNTLIRRLASARRSAEHIGPDAQVSFVYRAWNAWRAGDELHLLRVKAVGRNGTTVRVQIPKPA